MKTCGAVPLPETARSVVEVMPLPSVTSSKTRPFAPSVLDERGAEYFDGYASRVRQVSLADVARAAQLLQPAETVWVVVGDRAKVEAGLKELGLGEPSILDADGNPPARTLAR